MTTLDYSQQVIDGWTLRLRPSAGAPAAVLLALHGLTGDERSLDIFTARVPPEYYVIAPRGPIPAEPGFSWIERTDSSPLPGAAEFSQAVAEVERRLPTWFSGLSLSSALPIHLMGFSQGAALSLRLIFSAPRRYRSAAILAGFFPEGDTLDETVPDLSGMDFFIAHGTQDDTIPVEAARQMAARLEQTGAAVTYCEDAVGHKLGPSCFRWLSEFFSAPLG